MKDNLYLIIGILIVGVISVLSVNSGSITNISIALFLVAALMRRKEVPIFVGLVIATMVIDSMLLNSGSSISIISIIFYFFIMKIYMDNWNVETINNKVPLNYLNYASSQQYATVFVVFIIINIVYVLLLSGFNLAAILNVPAMALAIIQASGFLAIYMFAQRIYEASYFYLLNIFLKLVLFIYVSISTQTLTTIMVIPESMIYLITTALLGVLSGLFIVKNK